MEPISLIFFSLTTKFWAVINFLVTISQQIFAQATTAELSWPVQNFVVIALMEIEWKESKTSLRFGLCYENH